MSYFMFVVLLPFLVSLLGFVFALLRRAELGCGAETELWIITVT